MADKKLRNLGTLKRIYKSLKDSLTNQIPSTIVIRICQDKEDYKTRIRSSPKAKKRKNIKKTN